MPDQMPWEKYGQEQGPWQKYAQQPPPVGQNPLQSNPEKYTPEGLQEPKPNFVSSPTGLIRTGLGEAVGGIEHMAQPGREAKYEGLHRIIGGLGKAAIPAAIPAAVAAPLATAGAAGLGLAGSMAGSAGARALGAGPGASSLVGDVGGAIGGGLGGKLGGMLSKAATPLAESALGIRGAAREYGATPGKAILEETRGVRPGTIEKSAQSKVSDLTGQLETKARQAKQPISLAPARGIVSEAINSARAGNSVPNELIPILEHLQTPHKGFAGSVTQPKPEMIPDPNSLSINAPMVPGPTPPAKIAENQSPINYLGMKRRLGQDFTSFTPGRSTPESVDVANRVYGQMARDFNTAVPGGSALNQRIQSLLPVIKRAHAEELNPGPGERIMNRVARPTGGLAPLLFGFHEGGIPGALATMVGQEGLTSPVVRMIGARTLHTAGRPLPLAGGALVGNRTNQ